MLGLCVLSLFSLQYAVAQQRPEPALFGTGSWDADSLGNHRVVVSVERPADAVLAVLNWRRRDACPEQKNLIVVDAATGRRIMNVCRFEVNQEKGEIVFQPQTVPGKYYIYYLENDHVNVSRYYPQHAYPVFEETASPEWLKKNRLTGKKVPPLSRAEVVQYQAINDFHSFYPMEVIATQEEKQVLLDERPDAAYLLFAEDRRYPIRMTDNIPYKWIEERPLNVFSGEADKGEYYVFQLGVWAARQDVKGVRVGFSDLVNRKTGTVIPSSAFTCFNTGGIDVKGNVFKKECDVPEGRVQALWLGGMIPEQLASGLYQGIFTVYSENAGPQSVNVSINVSDRTIADHGDNEPWRLSRLRWLNSEIGADDDVIAPYVPLELAGRTIYLLGRKVTLDSTGLPGSITSYFEETLTGTGSQGRELLAGPMELDAGGEWENLDFGITGYKPGTIGWHAINRNDQFLMNLDANIEADGCLEFKITLIAEKDTVIDDIALRTVLAPDIARYMMGLGQRGGYYHDLDWKWAVEKNQDALWVGDVNAGLQLRFYDNRYVRPLNTNFYLQHPLVMPDSWCNDGAGGIRTGVKGDKTVIDAYSGRRNVRKGDRLYYYFTVLVTPFRPISTDRIWNERYHHSYEFLDDIRKTGANVINVHHATAINPYINYPFLRPEEMKAFVDGAHARDMRVKIYNTVRELSTRAPELYALFSLNHEIFSPGEGGGFSWLQEHLDQDYIAAWFDPTWQDAAVVTTGTSRWHNYYMEGLNWLAGHIGIDGIYIDDLAFDRHSMKRIRKILDRNNPNALIDLHSANQFNVNDGFANSANLYLEHFPYIDRLWFGEYFDYNLPPDFWLVEVSGLPYGLTGEMLQDGGNKWRGMLYGMTARSPRVDNGPLWRFWDEFGLGGSEMIGYWVPSCPVKTHSGNTLATVYRHMGEKSLIALATWENTDVQIDLDIDWDALGLDPEEARICAPAIQDYQEERSWKPGETVTVPAGKGLLIVVE